MSLFATLNTSILGMSAQATALSAIGDNIANASTTGYKKGSTEFETLLGNQTSGDYESGGVLPSVRYDVTGQGAISNTTSVTDVAVSGNGYFVVQQSNGATAMTRAGSFVPNANGDLVNTAGFKLMGYDLSTNSTQLAVVNVNSQALAAAPSTTGTLSLNLASTATTVAAASLPSTNSATATYTNKTSLIAYDNLGNQVNLDIYLTKTGTNTWQAAVFNKANAAAGGSFPYTGGALTTQALTFDPTNGNLAAASASALSVSIPNGNTISIDMSKTTQLGGDFAVQTGVVDGTPPGKFDHITIGKDGTVTQVYANGTSVNTFQIALGNVQSPNNLTALSGNAYVTNADSGTMQVSKAGSGGLGVIDSSSLEMSTVDLATELTDMISAQRGYEANSKVLQATSEMLKVITNLQV